MSAVGCRTINSTPGVWGQGWGFHIQGITLQVPGSMGSSQSRCNKRNVSI